MHDSTPAEPESAVICAWCKKILEPGVEPFSHGVCDRCLNKHLPQLAKLLPDSRAIKPNPDSDSADTDRDESVA